MGKNAVDKKQKAAQKTKGSTKSKRTKTKGSTKSKRTKTKASTKSKRTKTKGSTKSKRTKTTPSPQWRHRGHRSGGSAPQCNLNASDSQMSTSTRRRRLIDTCRTWCGENVLYAGSGRCRGRMSVDNRVCNNIYTIRGCQNRRNSLGIRRCSWNRTAGLCGNLRTVERNIAEYMRRKKRQAAERERRALKKKQLQRRQAAEQRRALKKKQLQKKRQAAKRRALKKNSSKKTR